MNTTSSCRHAHTRLVAKDKDAEYVECLDCGALLEAEELAALSQGDKPEEGGGPVGPTNFDESLSDA